MTATQDQMHHLVEKKVLVDSRSNSQDRAIAVNKLMGILGKMTMQKMLMRMQWLP